MKFRLKARVDTDDAGSLRPILESLVARRSGTVRPFKGGFEVELEWEGRSARDLNREFLSELRRAVKKTRLRSEWTAEGTTERFFDYVPKGTVKR